MDEIKKSRSELEKAIYNALTQKFINNSSEKSKTEEIQWVDVNITLNNVINVTMVTEQKLEVVIVQQTIVGLLEGNEKLFYKVGFIDLNTVEYAEFIGLEQPKPQIVKPIFWSDAVRESNFSQEEDTRTYKIVSFYSYKGGVGRTVAMIKTAQLLRQRGKRVLLIDLDLEAPGLHRIFKDKVNHKEAGVKMGLLDYLFHTIANETDDIQITDIFCQVEIDLFNEIFIVPATKRMDNDYIEKLSLLQSKFVYQERLLEKLLDKLATSLSVDIVLIDSRTGINDWGALSLLGFADQSILMAYPNAENMEGLQLITSLMDNAQKDNYVLALSKVISTEEGVQRANTLFAQLNQKQENHIIIPYREEIALSDYILSEDSLNDYAALADFILVDDEVKANIKKLQELKKGGVQLPALKEAYPFAPKSMFLERSTSFMGVILYKNRKDMDNLKAALKGQRFRLQRHFVRNKDNRLQIIPFATATAMLNLQEHPYVKQSLVSLTRDYIWIATLLYYINTNIYECRTSNDNVISIRGIEELKGKSMVDYFQYMEEKPEEQQLNVLRDALDTPDGLRNALGDPHALIYIDAQNMFNTPNKKEFLNSFIQFCNRIRKQLPDLKVGFFIDNNEIDKDFLLSIKGMSRVVEWQEGDLEGYLVSSITSENDSMGITLNQIIGARKIHNKHSESMVRWLFMQCQAKELQDYRDVTTIINNAASKGGTAPDRWIPLENLEQAFAEFTK